MQSSAGQDNELFFVVESCVNCGDHCGWHTRHVEAKYHEYYSKGKTEARQSHLLYLSVSVSNAITELIPNAITLRNQIPKSYLHYDLYCNLIPNEEPDVNFFNQVPRTGAFEVSFQGHVSVCQLALACIWNSLFRDRRVAFEPRALTL